jgi:uncharacterized coiled-coil DUF342 family protein
MTEKSATIGAKLTRLTKIVEKGFAAVTHELELRPTRDEVREIVEEVVNDRVPDIVREETKDIRDELRSIRRDLDALTEKVDNILGYRKEIDHALERIATIEKHLGLNKQVGT